MAMRVQCGGAASLWMEVCWQLLLQMTLPEYGKWGRSRVWPLSLDTLEGEHHLILPAQCIYYCHGNDKSSIQSTIRDFNQLAVHYGVSVLLQL